MDYEETRGRMIQTHLKQGIMQGQLSWRLLATMAPLGAGFELELDFSDLQIKSWHWERDAPFWPGFLWAHVQNKPWQKFNFTRWNVFFAKAPGFHVFPSLSKDITLCRVPQIEACSTRSQCAFCANPHVTHLAKGEGLTETETRSSSEVRIIPLFSVVHSRATEPQRGEGTEGPSKRTPASREDPKASSFWVEERTR